MVSRRRHGAKDPRHNAKLDGPCAEPPDAPQDAPGPSGSDGDGGGRDDAATWYGENAKRIVHVGRYVPYVGALGFRDGGGVSRTRAEFDFAPPNATLAESTRHGSLVLLDSCPPACPRCMGPARANRSERSPDSERRESGEWKPRRVSGAWVTVTQEGVCRVSREGPTS
jgi:hypothetical protein